MCMLILLFHMAYFFLGWLLFNIKLVEEYGFLLPYVIFKVFVKMDHLRIQFSSVVLLYRKSW